MSGISRAECRVVRSGESYVGRQGLTYLTGITNATVGASSICMTVVTMPPGARAKPHYHDGIETAIYVVEGEVEMRWGEGLRERLVTRAGDYVFIPANVPHLPMNRSESACVAVVAHAAADDQAGIVFVEGADEK